MQAPPIELFNEGAVGVMRFNSPRTLNALDVPMLLAMEQAIDRLAQDPSVRAIVITGVGDRAFVAGGDIRDLNTRRGLAHHGEFGEVVRRVFRRLESCSKPTLAAVNGWALGGGMELLLCTDIRLIADGAQIGLPEIKLGLFPGGGGSQRLMRQLPLCQAKLLMFTGDPITAAEALSLGLVNRVVPAMHLMAETMALAQRIAAQSPVALRMLKRAMLHGAEMPLDAALEYEQAMISLVFDSDDAHEGCSAFIEKRPPHFTGH
ncbi:enoyl-CoA hydratase/isomerase family protein [Variovorax sp. dw_954]|uniref:enoyl-CoA hydratase/isomerase family protein n=1 Tax=Variovorax sp. dw_954 TaxID=2720078 RepID=UPI001BD6753B|nr:enoyl-CoA hydratase/isomerase family protein [Variovorax sp. dw_954]